LGALRVRSPVTLGEEKETMRTHILIIATLLLLAGPGRTFAEPPYVPKPERTIQELVKPATSQFMKWCSENKTQLGRNQTPDSFFLAKLEYTNEFNGKTQGKWIWVATFESHSDASRSFTFIVGEEHVIAISRTST
jgi:hypothetical protein